jgi:hypothetical protein
MVTGEASPSYIFYPGALERIAELIPNVKIITLMRDPAERAYSHYKHNVRKGRENLSFEEAIENESNRLNGEYDRIMSNDSYVSEKYLHFSYLARGNYLSQIQRVERLFKRKQILYINSHEFFRNTQKVFDEVAEFLNIKKYQLKIRRVYNPGNYSKNSENKVANLTHIFKSTNDGLADHIGRKLDW